LLIRYVFNKKKLIQRNCSNRLGKGGISEIKNHPWLSSISWKDLYSKKIKPPFRPYFGDNFDSVPSDLNPALDNKTNTKNKNIVKEHEFKETFKNFKYFDRESNSYDDKKSVISVASFKSSNLLNPHLRYIDSQAVVDNKKQDYFSNMGSVYKSRFSAKSSDKRKIDYARNSKMSISFNNSNTINSNIIPGTNLFNSNISAGLNNK
jgi:hypothetical protein